MGLLALLSLTWLPTATAQASTSHKTQNVILVMRGPGIRAGAYNSTSRLVDIVPTLYRLLGVVPPAHVDGRVLDEILSP